MLSPPEPELTIALADNGEVEVSHTAANIPVRYDPKTDRWTHKGRTLNALEVVGLLDQPLEFLSGLAFGLRIAASEAAMTRKAEEMATRLARKAVRKKEQEIATRYARNMETFRKWESDLRTKEQQIATEAAKNIEAVQQMEELEEGAVPQSIASVPGLRRFRMGSSPPMCGIYFLVRAGVVVYVGQGVNEVVRLGVHCGDPTKVWDTAFGFAVPPSQLDLVERTWIDRLLPEYNRDMTTLAKKRQGGCRANVPREIA